MRPNHPEIARNITLTYVGHGINKIFITFGRIYIPNRYNLYPRGRRDALVCINQIRIKNGCINRRLDDFDRFAIQGKPSEIVFTHPFTCRDEMVHQK